MGGDGGEGVEVVTEDQRLDVVNKSGFPLQIGIESLLSKKAFPEEGLHRHGS